MRGKKTVAILMIFAVMLSICACGNGGVASEDEPDLTETALSEYASLPEIRFASFYGSQESGECRLKMRVPFDDEFNVGFTENGAKRVAIYDDSGGLIVSSEKSFDVELKKGDLVYVRIIPAQTTRITVNVKAKKHLSQLPFEVEGAPDTAQFDTTTVEGDPLKNAELVPKWRDHGKYIISSSPETLEDYCLNIAFTRHDVTNEEVFFTFEHNSAKLTSSVYYGYQVLNNGTEDAYVTVKNVGMQLSGPGAYYGDSAWVSFYNKAFALPDMSEWTEGEKKSYAAWFNFSGEYRNLQFQPVTYRIPAGQYIYVLGGTTVDAFNRYNVAGTANKKVRGSVQNGAVLFEVVGKAQGIFYVYDDPEKVGVDNDTPGEDQSKDENGNSIVTLNGINDGTLVETRAQWIFNDNTASQNLPVAFTNYYTEKPTGKPFEKVEYIPRERVCNVWYTHCNSQFKPDALSVDTKTLHTTCGGKPAIMSIYNYDAWGNLTNMGNWMVDYIDTYTFVNRGDRAREITVKVGSSHTGCLSVLARDEYGEYIEDSAKFAIMCKRLEYGDVLEYPAAYTITVPAHSVKQMSIEYNLLANSYGTVQHSVTLK